MSYFIEEYEIEGVTFYIRGLTVKEVTELAMDKKSKTKTSFRDSYFFKVAFRAIVGWEDMYALDEDGDIDMSQPIPFSPELVQQLPDHVLREIGAYAYSTLTVVSEDEEQKLRGYVRFAFYMSDKPDAIRDSFSCKQCLQAKKHLARKCGLTDEEREFILSVGEPEDDSADVEVTKEEHVQVAKRPIKKLTRVATKVITEEESEQKRASIKLGGFLFPECPVSWVDDHLRTIGEQLFFCHQNKVSYFSGGVSDQMYKIYSMVKIVGGETSTIENERMKESTGNNQGSKRNR